ncbi:unnamed protein product [Rotaria socialis]|uniref:Uncharacterized protein n=1 Tax=Rotaria socialis TaxID=392032 RepID=A0A818ZF25_9BILA|nr:unnamed protein product [Rotaria socialis]CAF3226381.1 unnamed protein product [Rotaria socialis]CAF3373685.1 unnamed protein product [Rotaria socialis]CAF3662087.1 unnamed protein product [Rotaria socialis]CAF3767656.1 unnamed protein product [Rotaria socialis]
MTSTEIIEQSNGRDGDAEVKMPLMYRIKTRSVNLLKSSGIFLFNKEQQTICGNTSNSWIKISLYYFIFYICSGLYYCGIMAVFGAIVVRQTPTYTNLQSKMSDGGKIYPGMGYRPMPTIDDTSLTVYNDTASQLQTISSLTNYKIQFLTQYDSTYLDECSPSNPASSLQGDRSCVFSWTDIVTSESHPCSTTNMYGWSSGKPCVLLKLNRIYNWLPAAGNIIDQIANATGQTILPIDQQEQNIYITCNGTTASDRLVIGNLTYYSILHPLGISGYGGIPYYFYPYTNSREQVDPFVLVQFTSLPLEIKVNVICRAWAPNIVQLSEGTTRRGVATFDILRSNKNAPKA